MKEPTDTGKNRTGIASSPIDSKRTIDGAQVGVVGTDGRLLEAERVAWSRTAEPLGSVPPPLTPKGAIKTIIEKLQGHEVNVLIDKLGERLQFERTGTRIYEAVLAKFDAADVHEGGPTRAELEQFHEEERRHFILVRDAIRQLGGDPTVVTPCADLVAVAGLGWVQAVTDPRTTLTQALDVVLIAELADNDGWHLLIDLAQGLGFRDMAAEFRGALAEEDAHLTRVRGWITTTLLGQSGVVATPPEQRPPA